MPCAKYVSQWIELEIYEKKMVSNNKLLNLNE